MRIAWEFDDADVRRVRAFHEQQRDNWFVRNRIKCNLSPDKAPVSVDAFWEILVGCLLTSQQASGPDRPVHRFINTRPYPLPYRDCCECDDLAEHALGVFKQFGGIRRTITICHELATNMAYLKNGGWEATEERLEHVRLARTAAAEREAALFLSRHFRGLGPKQSRNCSSGRGCPATRSRSTAASSAG